MLNRVPTVIGSYLPFAVGYKRYLVRFGFKHQVHELLFPAIAFDIEFGFNDLPDLPDIIVADMPFIGTRMHSYTICAKALHIPGSFNHIGIVTPTGISQRGDLIYVYRQFSHQTKIQ